MKSVLLGIGLMVVVSILAWSALDIRSTSSGEAFASKNSVRLD